MNQDIEQAGVAGVDEAGRGPLAGPVAAAAVILPFGHGLVLADSKQLSARRREMLAGLIRENAVGWSIALASAAEIDRLNIHHASLLAMKRALDALLPAPAGALIDGRFTPVTPLACRAIVHGDALEPAISAASILAKVYRDALMCKLDRRFPGYGFARHKGYGTRAHCEALDRLGPCLEHRRSFRPVREALAS
ncbi:MAG: ribonuclease HII [Gammaproteobacteria bacterium]|nr:ribonuclease HII [Gammaproteobacteria bacterium]